MLSTDKNDYKPVTAAPEILDPAPNSQLPGPPDMDAIAESDAVVPRRSGRIRRVPDRLVYGRDV